MGGGGEKRQWGVSRHHPADMSFSCQQDDAESDQTLSASSYHHPLPFVLRLRRYSKMASLPCTITFRGGIRSWGRS
jgi:hypothetical protein